MQKHIIMLIDHLESGGAPVVVRTLALALQEQGHAVTLITLSERLGPALSGIRQLALPYQPRGAMQRWFRYQHHAAKLDTLLDNLPPADLVLAHLHYSHQVAIRSKCASLAWLCIHSNPAAELLGNRRGLAKLIKQNKVKALYNQRNIIGVSQGIIASLLEKIGAKPKQAVAIYNPVDIQRIQALAKEPVEWQDYVVYVGRLSLREKRYDRLLRAYQQSGIQQKLLLVGGGELEQAQEHIARLDLQDRAILIGPTDNPYKYMSHARALILSSDYEGLPTVIIESFICGTPVVSTNCPSGPVELLIGEQARFLVPREDEAKLAQSIAQIVSYPPKLDESLFSRFAPVHIAKQYMALIGKR